MLFEHSFSEEYKRKDKGSNSYVRLLKYKHPHKFEVDFKLPIKTHKKESALLKDEENN